MPPSAAQVVVLVGPARSGKTNELVRHYRAALASAPPTELDRALWLAPNARTAAAVRDQLMASGLAACLRPGVLTFDDLTTQILAAANSRRKPLDAVLQRELLRRVVAQAIDSGKLGLFVDAASRSGFIDLVAQHIAELKRRGIGADTYANLISRRAAAEHHSELALLYAGYESLLATHGLVDDESAHDGARKALAEGACSRFQRLELIVADGFTDFTRTQHEILRLLAHRAKQLLISLPADADFGRLGATGPPYGRCPLGEAERATDPRSELFAKSAATFAELKHYHPHLTIREFERRPLPCPAIDHIAQHIFRQPQHVPSPSASVLQSLSHLEIVEASGAQDEIVQIARRVKALLSGTTEKGTGPFLKKRQATFEFAGKMDQSPFPAPAAPGDILVVFRSVAEVAPRIREVFSRFGIPFYLDATPPIATAPVIKTLSDLLLLEQDDWQFRRVVSVLTNNTLTAFDDDARRAGEWLTRDLQIASGRGALVDRAQSLAAEPSSPDVRSDYLQRRVTAATAALPALLQLAAALDELPEKATPTGWCEALSRLGARLGLSPFITPPTTRRTGRFSDQLTTADSNALNHTYQTDHAAWHALLAHFSSLEQLDISLSQSLAELSRRDLITILRDVATNVSLPRPHDDAGRVRVLSAPAARNVSARHLFLAGMTERAFPSPESAGRFASDADYRQFERDSHRGTSSAEMIAAQVTRAHAEMLLFYEMLSRAEESITISYPALDDKAQSLPPSPYVVELERLFGKDEDCRIPRALPQLSPISRSAEPRRTSDESSRSPRGTYSITDWRLQALARATEKNADRRLLAGIFASPETKPLAGAIDAGLRIVHARARGDSFGPMEGLLTSRAIAERLAQRFGPKHAWSASQWETYATCPFRFFMEDVLGLEPLGDLMLETDFARRGSRLHDVLASFHRQWIDVRAERSLEPDEEAAAFLAFLQQVVQERTSVRAHVGIDAALLELDRRQILKWAKSHFENQSKYESGNLKRGVPMKPEHFEFRFGPARRGELGADPDSTTDVFVLNIDGEPIHVTGQIDRIDVGKLGGKPVFSVIDYKSGRRASLKREMLVTGQQLQLPIYVEAAQALVFQGKATPLVAGYWSMGGGFDAKGALAGEPDDYASRWQETKYLVHRLIRELTDGIRQGDFPVASRDDKCTSYCDFRMVCRVAQVRSIGKTWWPDTVCDVAPDKEQETGDA